MMRRAVATWAAWLTLALMVPFLAYRFYVVDWVVSGIILTIMTSMAAVIVFLRAGGSELLALHFISVVYSGAVVTVTYVLERSGMLWLYPLMVANFYCLPRSSALAINTVAVAAATPALLIDPFLGVRVLATLGLVFMFGWVFSRALRAQRHMLASQGLTDPLTGTGNRRAMDLELAQAHRTRQRYDRPVSLVIVDLDHFKDINDRLGHRAGDEVLERVGAFLRGRLRQNDRVFRFGGEEFVILLPETRVDDARIVAESLRKGCGELRLDGIETLTLSAGVTELESDEEVEAWMNRADQALYRAKADGRNRVVVAAGPE